MASSGPGFCTPEEAIKGPKEEIMYVTCIAIKEGKPDYLAVVDVNPSSSTYCQVVNRLMMPVQSVKDELHHFGWNACSSCHHDPNVKRDKLIFPCLNSDRIYIVDVTNEKAPRLHKTIEPEEMHKHGLSAPHTTHCLANGDVMISTMGDENENARGNFFILDGRNDFEVKGAWSKDSAPFGYDFWYQPAFDAMVSTQWGAPKAFRKGFSLEDVANNLYGSSVTIWSWKDKKIIQNIDLGPEGITPLEVRFLHNPKKPHAYVGCAVASAVFHIHQVEEGKWAADKVIAVPPKKVEGWHMGLSDMPAVITDILISMDDKFLYFSNWVHGDIRQYDISDPASPKLVGQVFIGGSITQDTSVKVIEDSELEEQPEPVFVKGRKVSGGPQMLQLSLDGKRLYVTTSLFYPWDRQFYGDLIHSGTCMLQIDVNTASGGLQINKNFLVDFGKEPEGPCLAHEMRYPGGDCSSDIFLTKCNY